MRHTALELYLAEAQEHMPDRTNLTLLDEKEDLEGCVNLDREFLGHRIVQRPVDPVAFCQIP